MSYNVDNWKTKELKNLKIPLKSFFKHERKDWHPIHNVSKSGEDYFEFMDQTYIVGKVIDDVLLVSEIMAVGEGSGTVLDWIIEPALADSTGKLVAVRVWEGGDSIDRLIVNDGEITVEDIEL